MTSTQCKNCLSVLNGKFCSNCGQKDYSEKDKSIKSLFEETIHFLTHFEGKLLKTVTTIYKTPGKLSTDYSAGIRQKYYKPISLYLITIIVYLIFPLASGMNMEMTQYKQSPIFGKVIARQIDIKLKEHNVSENKLSEIFHNKSKNTSKILMLLMIPLAIPFVYILYYKRKRYIYDNVILTTEINIFFLMTIFLIMPLIISPISALFKTGINDNYFGATAILVFSIYTTFLFRNVFKEKWLATILKACIFTMLFTVMTVMIYRVIVFQVTFALI